MGEREEGRRGEARQDGEEASEGGRALDIGCGASKMHHLAIFPREDDPRRKGDGEKTGSGGEVGPKP